MKDNDREEDIIDSVSDDDSLVYSDEKQQKPVESEMPSDAAETAAEVGEGGQHEDRWYVIQVFGGYEDKVCAWCKTVFAEHPGILQACFVPRREERIKVHGEWKTVRKRLFIGYVFLISPDLEALYMRLWDIPELTRLIGTGREIIALTDDEIAFLQQFLNQEGVAELSTGIIEGDRVRILSGSLVGLETRIVKIDRHKRKAWIELDILGERRQIPMGLEVAMKKISEPTE